MLEIFRYGQRETDYLKSRDQYLAQAIDHIGVIERPVIPQLFPALVNSIVSQQVSMKAADTVWERMLQNVGEITPQNIAWLPAEKIQQCGITMKKAFYIKNAASKIISGDFDIDELPGLPDSEVVKRLVSLKGIGIWTAEMLMIFSMQRPDIVSWNDLAIRRGMMMLYRQDTLSRDEFEQYRRSYSPYGSVASLYLWELSRLPAWPL